VASEHHPTTTRIVPTTHTSVSCRRRTEVANVAAPATGLNASYFAGRPCPDACARALPLMYTPCRSAMLAGRRDLSVPPRAALARLVPRGRRPAPRRAQALDPTYDPDWSIFSVLDQLYASCTDRSEPWPPLRHHRVVIRYTSGSGGIGGVSVQSGSWMQCQLAHNNPSTAAGFSCRHKNPASTFDAGHLKRVCACRKYICALSYIL
jgi:hypothetical protein